MKKLNKKHLRPGRLTWKIVNHRGFDRKVVLPSRPLSGSMWVSYPGVMNKKKSIPGVSCRGADSMEVVGVPELLHSLDSTPPRRT